MESYLKPIRTASKAAWSTDHQDEVDGKYDTRHAALRGDCREASASGMKLGVSGTRARRPPWLASVPSGHSSPRGNNAACVALTHFLFLLMLIFRSHFHTSVMWQQKPNHALYPLVDWSKVDAGHYAVVDPFDNHAILYLSERTYQVQVRVSLSQDSPLVVLARPGDCAQTPSSPASRKEDPSQNSPPDLTKNSKVWKKFLSWHLSALKRLGKDASPSGDAKSVKTNKGPASTSPELKTSENQDNASVALSAAVLRTLIPYWGLELHFRMGGDLTPSRALVSGLREMADRMAHLLEHHGRQQLILRMKAALFLLNRRLAGSVDHNPWLLGTPVSLSRGGIPRLIPVILRRRILGKDATAIRMVNSILNAYKAFEGDHEMQDLASVTGPHPTLDPVLLAEFRTFCKEVFWTKVVKSNCETPQKWESISRPNFCIGRHDPVYVPLRAGPNASTGLLGAHLDAAAWLKQPRNLPMEWARHVGDERTISLFSECTLAAPWMVRDTNVLDFLLPLKRRPVGPVVGKVCLLPEPAGKVRTIAIVDYWTQRLMSPVHDWMMGVLRLLPTDGTFNQEEALESFSRLLSVTPQKVFSIDLKSATDLIPIELYRAVMSAVWDERTTDLWIDLLTDRDFLVPPSGLVKPDLRDTFIRYGRGQPMGTLSSWPSMALVHHALELFAAQKAGRDPVTFMDYRILGDDNVTAGEDVAEQYTSIASGLCVPTSAAKTLEGRLFIFASQIYLDGVNISPLSLKEELGIETYGQRLEIALRAMRRGWLKDGCTVPRFLRLLLTQRDYATEVKKWSSGVLGKISQSALVSAFGIAKRGLLDLLGFQGSGWKPFSLALANKVEALAGDQGLRVKKNRAKILAELERDFAIACARFLYEDFGRQLKKLEVSRLRFHTWGELVQDGSWITPFWKRTTAKGANGVIDYVGIPLVKEHSSDTVDFYLTRLFLDGILPQPVYQALQEPIMPLAPDYEGEIPTGYGVQVVSHRLLWPVLRDSYTPLFGPPEFADAESEEDGWGGVGISIGGPDTMMSPTTGAQIRYPDITSMVTDLRARAEKVWADLVKLPAEEMGNPWYLVTELSEILAKVSRLPTFIGLSSIEDASPERQPDKLDAKAVRMAKALTSLVAVMPFGTDFSAPLQTEMPLGPLSQEEAFEDLQLLGAELTAKTNQGLLTGYPTASLIENNVGAPHKVSVRSY